MENQQHDIDWKTIAEATLAQKTILILGPELSINFEKPNLMDEAFDEIAQTSPRGLYLSYNAKDGFMIVGDRRAKILAQNKIKDFFANDFSNPLLEKLSEIPFHLILSLTPDLTPELVFQKKKFLYDSNYYSGKNLRAVDKMPTGEQPLIYHLFGSIEDTESMLISYSDLYKYLKSIFAYEYIPEQVKRQINGSAEHIIFLGVDFEKWYYQLILNMFNLDEDPCMQYALSVHQMEGNMKSLYEEHFKITFVSKQSENFIEQLHAAFEPQQLRKASEEDAAPKKYIVNNVLKFLNAAYNPTDFETLCLCNFEEVHNEFTGEQSKTTRINALLDFVKRTERFDELLRIGKEDNPVQFEKFQPYAE